MEFRLYQLIAIEKALEFPGFALFMEQRTGKTSVAMEIAKRRQPKRLLITCPEIAFAVWRKELSDSGGVLGCVTRIITHDSLWRQRKRLKRWAPDGIIADETHRFKAHDSRRSKALRLVAKYASWRLALTGTPIAQGIWDAWAQFDFMDPSIFGLWSEFQERYLTYGGYYGHKIVGTRNVKEFQQKFHSRTYRVLLENVQTTKTKISTRVVKFDLAESRPAYDSMEETFIAELNATKRVIAPRVITQVLKLHQLSGGFIIDEDRKAHHVGDEKLTQAGALILTLGEPVVVVVRFLPELRRLNALCLALGLTTTKISGSNKFVDFKTDVAIIQIQSGMSIDLARSAQLIFYSMNHSYLDFDQARFRVRSFDSKAVGYYFLLARNTIDEDIYNAVSNKQGLAKFIIDKYRRRT